MKLELIHADTCLPCYWQGHHKAHVQIPVWHGMSLRQIKDSIKYEIAQGAIAGSDNTAYLLGSDRVPYDRAKDVERITRAAYAAVNRLKPNIKGQRRFFNDLEPVSDDDEFDSVYAFFVFSEI